MRQLRLRLDQFLELDQTLRHQLFVVVLFVHHFITTRHKKLKMEKKLNDKPKQKEQKMDAIAAAVERVK